MYKFKYISDGNYSIAGYKRCNKNQFECSNRICISRDQECNGIDDCGDNSDEMSVCGEFKMHIIESTRSLVSILGFGGGFRSS